MMATTVANQHAWLTRRMHPAKDENPDGMDSQILFAAYEGPHAVDSMNDSSLQGVSASAGKTACCTMRAMRGHFQ